MSLLAYSQLMRMDKPIGIMLLWYPTAWALWLANAGKPAWFLVLLFFLGTVVMRAAGCVVNDYFDRNFDSQVQRTRERPLASGRLKPVHALGALAVLLTIALIILLNLPVHCFYYALISLGLTGIYPLCKRFIQAPQLVLSLAFSMGIPMAYVASGVNPNVQTLFLFVVNMFWIIAYDTQYALADRPDDLRAGIKSTAVFFGKYTRFFIVILQTGMHLLWLFWALNHAFIWTFYLFWGLGLLNLVWQYRLLNEQDSASCIQAFRSNNFYGACMWAAITLTFL